MNCMEFRRLCLANPYSEDAEFQRHLRDCSACASFATQQRQLDRGLREAMQVPVPVDLGPRTVFERGMRQMRRWRVFAIAASVLLAATLTVVLSLQQQPGAAEGNLSELHQALVEHMINDPIHAVESPSHLVHHHHPDRTDLSGVANRLGGTVVEEPDGLIHAVVCLVQNKVAGHLVLEGKLGPVTAFLLPHHEIGETRELRGEAMNSRFVATGHGTVAIIGHQGEALDDYARELQRTIHWPDTSQARLETPDYPGG